MIIISKSGFLKYKNFKFRCALGKNGVGVKKIEGDNITPKGTYKIIKVYHRKDLDPFTKRIVMAATLGFICIAAINIVNDMVETDKVGSFFFVYMALIVNIDIKSKQQRLEGEED